MNITRHFSLEEMTFSQDAARYQIDNTPGVEEVAQLRRLCVYILEPLRAALDRPVVVSSGYRNRELNAMVGGAKRSHHVQGRAADITVPGLSALEICQAIVDLELPFDQCIHEFGRWCHVSVAEEVMAAPRQTLTARHSLGKVVYEAGLNRVLT